MEKYNRRKFLYRLGAGTAIAISGFVTVKYASSVKHNASRVKDGEGAENPVIKQSVRRITDESGELSLESEQALCKMNHTGRIIVERLDGKHSPSDISAEISTRYGITLNGELEGSVATFICRLGEYGFLEAPFYVTLYGTYG